MAHSASSTANCRNLLTAVQISISERYANRTLDEITDGIEAHSTKFLTECFMLAELDKNGAIPDKSFAQITVTETGKVKKLIYTDGHYTVTYENGDFTAVRGADINSSTVELAS
ncbi:MAG: hypothetical protein ACI4KA_04770 [Oscillospiraceae bacterium]